MDGDRNGIIVEDILDRLLLTLSDSDDNTRKEGIMLLKHCLEGKLYQNSRLQILDAFAKHQDEHLVFPPFCVSLNSHGMSSPPPKCSGWRIKGKQKLFILDFVKCRYYLSITCRKFFKQKAIAACRRDKRILAKPILGMMSEVNFFNTVMFIWML